MHQKNRTAVTRNFVKLNLYLFAILIMPTLFAGKEIEFTFKSSYDKSPQLAVAYIPESTKPENKPLLVIAHYWGGNRFTAKKSGYYTECDKRNWLLVCPELHGHNTRGKTSLAALEAQHDIIDAINYMKNNYKIDNTRIYLAGRSMGGMLAEVMAAKYPDVFAGVMAGQAISDLKRWIEESPRFKNGVEKECGKFGPKTEFEYSRRSTVNYARNLQYVPLLMWHGTNDTWVSPEQSERLWTRMQKFDKFILPVFWLQNAGHCAANYSPEWICEQLSVYQNICESGLKVPTRFYPGLSLITDEAKAFFWLNITPNHKDQFATVDAEIVKDTLKIKTTNVSKLVVLLDQIPTQTIFKSIKIKSDGRLCFQIRKADAIVFDEILTNELDRRLNK